MVYLNGCKDGQIMMSQFSLSPPAQIIYLQLGSAASSNRYDLDESTRRMKESTRRIKDIHDLVDDDFDDSLADEDEIVEKEFRIGQHKFCWKYTALLVSVMGIIGGASIAIGYTVKNSSNALNNNSKNNGETFAGEEAAPKELIDLVGHTNLKKNTQPAYSVANTGDVDQEEMGKEQQELLEMAERIVLACSEDQLAMDMTQCDYLCWSARCCFDTSCDDVHMQCAAYAGCQVLVYGVPEDGEEQGRS